MTNPKVQEYPVVWILAGACTGCSVSVLNSVSPDIKNVLVDEVIPGKHLNLRFHPTVMAGQGDIALKVLKDTEKNDAGKYILVVDGAIATAENGIYCMAADEGGHEITMAQRVEGLARNALAIIAIGTCAAYGGIAGSKPNPGGFVGTETFLKMKGINKPLINVPGCPPHPDWFVGTVASVMLAGLPTADQIDEYKRPKAFYGNLIHENCPRRGYFDEGKFAKKFGEPGCLNELGCKGPVTHADCPKRGWNNNVNWCINGGAPCIGCASPHFPDYLMPVYQKLDEQKIPAIGTPRKEVK
jgi:hydrogenase small subunit